MVLWEITVITAYFLGLKRTFRLALRIQRRLLVGPNHPRIRHFLLRRTRNVFDVAVNVHKNIQQRDIEVGRSLGNWVLRFLDRMKPSAQIRRHPPELPTSTKDATKQATGSGHSLVAQKGNARATEEISNGRVLFAALNIRPKHFPTISVMMPPRKAGSLNNHFRHMSYYSLPSSSIMLDKRKRLLERVFRNDIAQWMLH